MHEEPKALLGQALHDSLLHLQPLVTQAVTQYLVWQKLDGSRWNGEFQPRPDEIYIFREADNQIIEASIAFRDSFSIHHPEYHGDIRFLSWQSNWSKFPPRILHHALEYLWWQHKSFHLNDAQVDAVVEEFSEFVDRRTVRLRFQAQLINFSMPTDSLALPGCIAIRRLSEKEISEIYGGRIDMLGLFHRRPFGMHEFIVEGELDEPKILGNEQYEDISIAANAKVVLDKAIRSLRTFKSGRVGYNYIYCRPVTFCPLAMSEILGSGDEFIPFGRYSLNLDEYQPLVAHAKLIFACSESVMELACTRLADAENRTRSQDCIIDAVIGMEAMLLSAIGKEERRSELSFRFSLNFAMLFPPEERQKAYQLSRDLYNLRSLIAHGASLDEGKVKVAGEKLTLFEAGKLATNALRTIIFHFLPKGVQYKDPGFWQRAYLNLSEII